jgi:hypothetical protein
MTLIRACFVDDERYGANATANAKEEAGPSTALRSAQDDKHFFAEMTAQWS